MHLVFIPVVHTKDKEENAIDKICSRDFWKGRDSYRTLQNNFYDYITSKGFELERGLPVEETGAKNQRMEDLKRITNYENTKKVLESITKELPNVPDINDIKLIKLNKEKIQNEIIKPKDTLINELYDENIKLHKELSKQVVLVDKATKYEKERSKILSDNEELHTQVDNMNAEYKVKEMNLEWKYKNRIHNLEKENKYLYKVVDRFKDTIVKFVQWICKKFDMGAEDEVIKDFERETGTYIDAEKQIKHEERQSEWDLEL